MTIQEKLDQSTDFLFYKSRDISTEPDMGGLKSGNPSLTREAYQEIYKQTEKAFIRVSFYVMGNTLRLQINNIKNNHIVTVNNLAISADVLKDLQEASQSSAHNSMGFAIFPSPSKEFTIYPMSENEIILFIKSWELIVI